VAHWASHLPLPDPPPHCLDWIPLIKTSLLPHYQYFTLILCSCFGYGGDDSQRGGKLGQRKKMKGEGKEALSSCITEWDCYHGCGYLMTPTPILMCILIRSCLKVFHDDCSLQRSRTAFKPFAALNANRVKCTQCAQFTQLFIETTSNSLQYKICQQCLAPHVYCIIHNSIMFSVQS